MTLGPGLDEPEDCPLRMGIGSLPREAESHLRRDEEAADLWT
jgi:hypothetical protein